MLLPNYLTQGDLICIVCPSGYMPLANVKTCIQVLQKQGYKVQLGKTVGNQDNYFAGTPEERLQDLQAALDNKDCKAILCGRGGYGLSQIIDKLSFTKFKKHPKFVIGFSDITLLHSHINSNQQIISIHSPMAAAFNDGGYKNKYVQSLLKLLKGEPEIYNTKWHKYNKQGKITAPLVGGNLSLIAHSIGTKSAYDFKKKILFLEDIGEYLYNIDRMLIQLKRAGIFSKISGLIIGGFTDCKDTTLPFGKDIHSIINNHISDLKIPVCFNFPIGHQPQNFAVKVGATYTLKVETKQVSLQFEKR